MGTLTWEQLHEAMSNCGQTPGMSIRQHGQSVWKYFQYIENILNDLPNSEVLEIRLPSWFEEYGEQVSAILNPASLSYWYIIYHDCGKPICKIVDDEGKQHFPNHSQVSYETWLRINESQSNLTKEQINIIADLIYYDMAIHIMTAEEIERLMRKLTPAQMITLLIAALAEIHSNAEMFGGIESRSFKIKFKQIERRGKQICKKLFEN